MIRTSFQPASSSRTRSAIVPLISITSQPSGLSDSWAWGIRRSITSSPESPGKHRVARLILADFKLYLVGFRFADVGWIGNNEIERAALKALQQVGLMESNPAFELVASCIGPGDFQGCR